MERSKRGYAMELTELLKLNEKFTEVFDSIDSLNESLNKEHQTVRLLLCNIDNAKDKMLQIIGEATINGKLS